MASSENPQITLSPSRSISDICWLGISLHLGVDVAVDDAVAVAQLFDCQSLHRWLLAIQVTCFLFCPLICSSCCRAAAVAAVMLLLLCHRKSAAGNSFFFRGVFSELVLHKEIFDL